MQKVIIKHISGSKANQTEIFELPIDVITFGRDASCQVAYDPLKDDLVSRIHLKITLNEGNQFLLTDLNSSNGTFVNEQKITKPVTLQAGDIVQLGKDGAKFEFDLDPRPTLAPKTTRLQESIPLPKPTRESVISQTAESLYSEADTQNMGTKQKRGVGRETVERMIAQVESEAQSKIAEAKSDTRRKMINISAGIFTVIVLVAGYLVYHSSITTEQLENNIAASKEEQARKISEIKSSAAMSAAEISKNYGPATVFIETSWKLRDVQSGQQLYQMQICKNIDIKRKKKCDSNDAYPAYVYFKEGEREYVEPILFIENEEDIFSGVTTYEKRLPIGGIGTGSGFVVDENGFILTNSHVAAGWETPFDIKTLKFPGLIY